MCAAILITTIAANFILKNKLENFINKDLSENMISSYATLSVHTLDGTVMFTKPLMVIQNKDDKVKHTFVNAEKLIISGFSYWDYFFKKEIHIDQIILENPSFVYYPDKIIEEKDSIQKKNKMDKPIFVEDLKLTNSTILVYEKGEDSTKISVENLSLEMDNIHVNEEIFNRKIPFEYRDARVTGDSLFVKANDYDNLTVENFSWENKNVIFNNLTFKTKYSKSELSRVIDVERDHYNLSIKLLSINQLDFGYIKEDFFAKSKKVILDTPSLTIFRDKLVADDLSIKPLYSKSLRELPFQLTVDSMTIKNGLLEYEERVKEENAGGSINFKNLNATISNVSNNYGNSEKTELKIKALFMEKTPLSVNWSFDVQNKNDGFLFKADVGLLEAEKMNAFTEPNLKVRLEGSVDRTYFTIDGNNDSSKTDIKINYSDFKVTVLQKDGKNKNKFLSAVVNIFISKDSEKKSDQYREAFAEATRDKTKSIFNFLWISVKSALEKSMTGNSN